MFTEPDMMGYVLVARVLDLQMPYSENCSLDYVEIRDGPHQDSPLVARFVKEHILSSLWLYLSELFLPHPDTVLRCIVG